jgi:teichoic acid transport system ATP-binding protein
MNSDIAVAFERVSKVFKIYARSLDRVKQLFTRKVYYTQHQALESVDFSITKGETVGLIGKNGSGKSTILQVVCGIMRPTSGSVDVNGRVSALLELGSGFNPEFTGRENIYMNCAILGLTKEEIDARLHTIEAFAEIGEYIDRPVRTYSSGMFVRLAFSCAIHVEPEILIVDEALAVGDMQFQLKCIEKMKELKKMGVTILFVSHDTYTVRNFCTRVIWLQEGRIVRDGDPVEIIEEYHDYMKNTGEVEDNEVLPGHNEAIAITGVDVIASNGLITNTIPFKDSYTIAISYTLKSRAKNLVAGVALYDREGIYISGLNTKVDGYMLPDLPGSYRLSLQYQGNVLMPGTYLIEIGFFESEAIVPIHYSKREYSLTISSGQYISEGLVYLMHKWDCEERT